MGDAKKARTDDPYADWQSARDPDTDKVYYYNAKTQATCWEWPPPVSVPAGSGGDFEPSPTYTGVRKGYVFKLGAHGQGYYKDAPPNVAPPEEPVLDFVPSRTFTGARKGMVFRRGDRGQGFYRDNPFGGKKAGEPCERYNPHA